MFKRNGDELAELQVKLDALDATDKKAADLPMLIAKNEEQLLALEKVKSLSWRMNNTLLKKLSVTLRRLLQRQSHYMQTM